MNQKNDVKNLLSEPISIVPTAVNGCLPAEAPGVNTVTILAARGPTENGNAQSKKSSRVGFTNTKPNAIVTRLCQHCGREMTVKRPSKRFCNSLCRRAAWLKRNPEKAAALAISDKARLRAHLESKGIAWVEQAA